ncbi:aminotransferase class V-fold PLP-dependent enzyme [bacterium]|nr:aminotransferase class V-fold PLP-dependent enzyme [bacterium]
MSTSAIYLDNAATSFPKPECVYVAVDRYQRENGRPVGRGSTDAAIELQRIVDRCRLRAAQLLGATAKEQIVFTFNCTDSLNTVLHGLLAEGDHVVTSQAEHNSVLRPLRQLERTRGVAVTLVEIDDAGFFRAEDVAAAVRPETRLIMLQHASNVTGAIQPIEAVGEFARQKGIAFAVDAAQTAGHLPVNVQQLHADFLACAGHKGLLGPLGTGLLYIAPGRESELTPLRQGGTGSRSELDTQPETMPDRFESGNHNAPGIVGLDAALGWLIERGIDTVRDHELALTEQLIAGLREIPSLRIFSHDDRTWHTGVVSVLSELYASDELASLLSGHFQIDTRAGLHCAPLIHRRLGTIEQQGTVRFSVGVHNTAGEIDAAIDALRQVSDH